MTFSTSTGKHEGPELRDRKRFRCDDSNNNTMDALTPKRQHSTPKSRTSTYTHPRYMYRHHHLCFLLSDFRRTFLGRAEDQPGEGGGRGKPGQLSVSPGALAGSMSLQSPSAHPCRWCWFPRCIEGTCLETPVRMVTEDCAIPLYKWIAETCFGCCCSGDAAENLDNAEQVRTTGVIWRLSRVRFEIPLSTPTQWQAETDTPSPLLPRLFGIPNVVERLYPGWMITCWPAFSVDDDGTVRPSICPMKEQREDFSAPAFARMPRKGGTLGKYHITMTKSPTHCRGEATSYACTMLLAGVAMPVVRSGEGG